MAGLLGQAVTAFQSLLSRGFWFGSFLPVAIFAALNLVVAQFADIPWATRQFEKLQSPDFSSGALVVVLLVVLSYALSPLVQLCRYVLDGRNFPEFLSRQLLRQRLLEDRHRRDELQDAALLMARTENLQNNARTELLEARSNAPPAIAVPQPNAMLKANVRIRRLEKRLEGGGVAGLAELEQAVAAVKSMLRTNDASVTPEPDRMLRGLTDLLAVAADNAKDAFNRKRAGYQRYPLPPDKISPTEIGDSHNRSEYYCKFAYNADFDFIWPRILMVIPENDPAAKRIDAARSLIDFAVLSLVLEIVLLAVWLPILAVRANGPVPFLLLGTFGPLLVKFLHQLVLESQTAFGDLAQGMIDQFRFKLLATLHIKPPASLSEERAIWRRLSDTGSGERPDTDFVWAPPA